VYAARSNRVPQDALLPQEAPVITVWFCEDIDTPFRFHPYCQGAGPWLTHSERVYDSKEALIHDLVTHKNHFWCQHFERRIFFPISCIKHADTAEVVNEADVADMADVSSDEEEDDIVM